MDLVSVVREYADKYRQLVVSQPLVLSEVESAVRWMSYLAAGKVTVPSTTCSHP